MYGNDGWPAGAQPAQYPPQQAPAAWGGPPPVQAPAWGGPPPQQAPAWGGPPPQAAQQAPAGPPPDPDELMGGGYKAAQFPDQAFGTTVGGTIVAAPHTTQQRDFDSGQLKFYPDTGAPAWQIVVPVQAQRATGDDDGVRAFYLKGQMKQAAQLAVRQAGAAKLEQGGQLFMRYVRDEPNARGRGKPKKIYEGKYVPPAGGSTPAPAAAPVAPQGAPAQQTAHYPGASGGPTTYAPPAAGGGNGGPQTYSQPPAPAAGYMGAGDVAGAVQAAVEAATPPDPWGNEPPY
jgi:hypothetical protein